MRSALRLCRRNDYFLISAVSVSASAIFAMPKFRRRSRLEFAERFAEVLRRFIEDVDIILHFMPIVKSGGNKRTRLIRARFDLKDFQPRN